MARIDNFKGKIHKITAEEASKGGRVSKRGTGMRQMLDFLAAEQTIKGGGTLTGHQITQKSLLAVLADPKNKNYGVALNVYLKLMEHETSDERAERKAQLECYRLREEIELMKVRTKQALASAGEEDGTEDDGFLAALDGKAAEVWKDEE